MARKFLALALLLACVGSVRAEAAFSVTGVIAFPGPTGRVRAGVTEMTSPCGVDSSPAATQGFDGYWISLPGAGEVSATMTSDAIDANVYFYDAECRLIGGTTDPLGSSMATDLTSDEHGAIPTEARYAIVDVIVGSNVTFTFWID